MLLLVLLCEMKPNHFGGLRRCLIYQKLRSIAIAANHGCCCVVPDGASRPCDVIIKPYGSVMGLGIGGSTHHKRSQSA